MLSYLDALIAALSLRDAPEAERLLAHPLARLLAEDVQEEARAFAAGECDALAAPLRTMLQRRQTAELLHEAPALADQVVVSREAAPELPRTLAAGRRPHRGRPQQMELPLSA